MFEIKEINLEGKEYYEYRKLVEEIIFRCKVFEKCSNQYNDDNEYRRVGDCVIELYNKRLLMDAVSTEAFIRICEFDSYSVFSNLDFYHVEYIVMCLAINHNIDSDINEFFIQQVNQYMAGFLTNIQDVWYLPINYSVEQRDDTLGRTLIQRSYNQVISKREIFWSLVSSNFFRPFESWITSFEDYDKEEDICVIDDSIRWYNDSFYIEILTNLNVLINSNCGYELIEFCLENNLFHDAVDISMGDENYIKSNFDKFLDYMRAFNYKMDYDYVISNDIFIANLNPELKRYSYGYHYTNNIRIDYYVDYVSQALKENLIEGVTKNKVIEFLFNMCNLYMTTTNNVRNITVSVISNNCEKIFDELTTFAFGEPYSIRSFINGNHRILCKIWDSGISLNEFNNRIHYLLVNGDKDKFIFDKII